MSYTPTIWENGKKPAINATNLNKIEEELVRLGKIVSVPDISETTETTMPNSYDGRLKVEEIGGVCEQNTTSGKNILKNKATSTTTKGVTFTVNADGTVVVNGTASEDVGLTINSNFALEIGKSYVLSGCPSGGSASTYRIRLTDANYVYNNYDVGNGVQFEEKTGSAMAILIIYAGCTVNNLVFKPMVRLASVTDATYEPYTGGIPSPNPSYPQEIKKTVVSEIRTRGKNFFDITTLKPRSAIQGGTVSFDGDTANISSAGQYWATCRSGQMAVKSGEKYFIRFKVSNYSATTRTGLSIGDVKGNRYNVGFFSANGYYEFVFTPTTDIAIVSIMSNDTSALDVTNTFTISECQIEEGTVATEYEPYTESVITLSQPIDLYGMGDVQDILTPKGIDSKFESLKLTNTLNWAVSQSTAKRYILYPPNRVKPYTIPICTHYIGGNVAGYPVWINVGNQIVFDTEFDTFDEWMNFINTNDVKVVYQIETPTTEAIPIADQIGLNSLQTYDGITYLEFDSEIEPTFKGEYGTSKVGGYALEGMLAGRNGELYGKDYNSRLSALEASVVNNI